MPSYVWVPEEARTFDAMELELEAIMSLLMWVLGTELIFLAKAVCASNRKHNGLLSMSLVNLL